MLVWEPMDGLPKVRDSGRGAPLLLLHAFPLDSEMWAPQVAELEASHRCLCPDFWGCGQSPGAPVSHTLDDYCEALLLALDNCGVERFAVAGVSMGGYIALALLKRAVARMTHLVLVSTKATADSDEALAERLGMADRLRREGTEFLPAALLPRLLSPDARTDDALCARVTDLIRRNSADGLAAAQEAMAHRGDTLGHLAGAPATLCVAGGEDVITPLSEMERIVRAAPSARLEVLPRAGHLLTLEEPGRFTEMLRDFLAA